jgi:hypothetical protein
MCPDVRVDTVKVVLEDKAVLSVLAYLKLFAVEIDIPHCLELHSKPSST